MADCWEATAGDDLGARGQGGRDSDGHANGRPLVKPHVLNVEKTNPPVGTIRRGSTAELWGDETVAQREARYELIAACKAAPDPDRRRWPLDDESLRTAKGEAAALALRGAGVRPACRMAGLTVRQFQRGWPPPEPIDWLPSPVEIATAGRAIRDSKLIAAAIAAPPDPLDDLVRDLTPAALAVYRLAGRLPEDQPPPMPRWFRGRCQQSFADDNGATWHIAIGPRAAAKLKADGLDLTGRETLLRLVDDPLTQFDVAVALCRRDGSTESPDPDQFERDVFDSWPAMVQTLQRAVLSYLRRMGMVAAATSLERAIDARRRIEAVALDRVGGNRTARLFDDAVTKAGDLIDRQIDEAAAEIAGSDQTDAQPAGVTS